MVNAARRVQVWWYTYTMEISELGSIYICMKINVYDGDDIEMHRRLLHIYGHRCNSLSKDRDSISLLKNIFMTIV